MEFELYHGEVVYDNEVSFGVFSKTLIKIDSIYKQIVEIKEKGYTFKDGKFINGKEGKELLYDLESKYELLQELMESADSYRK